MNLELILRNLKRNETYGTNSLGNQEVNFESLIIIITTIIMIMVMIELVITTTTTYFTPFLTIYLI